ncbi:MAG: class I SAM-dependent DNA methyltransferase [Thermoanaerobaculia bacterium]
MNLADFIAKWRPSGASERANKDAFLLDLCAALDVEKPNPKTGDVDRDDYVFEREAVLLHDGGRQTLGFIDLYKKGFFILEAKQGSHEGSKKIATARRGTPSWNAAMQEAFGQALTYSQTIETPPPFIIITDIGYCFDLYASFDGTRNYRKFPDALSARIHFDRLADKPQHLELLRKIFTDPHALDPSKRAARITREIAGHIASLARSLEAAKHDPELVAKFLMRCLFTMYAEDVQLLPKGIFSEAVERWIEQPESFPGEVEDLWKRMNEGGDLFGRGHIWRFNGGLFAEPVALPLDREQLLILGLAAKSDWRDVEPAIFGTLLERALDPKERHRLGAHYTPRAYVERLVRPTIEEPVRGEWDSVRAAVQKLLTEVDPDKNIKAVAEARKLVYAFYDRLTRIRVLDPACGSGNFLFVALDLFKRIENEVLDLLDELGETRALYSPSGRTVTPEQFLGIEVKPWAKEITELVLWIGWLQWQIRTRGWASKPAEPILRDYHNIECRDAVLAWDSVEPLLDDEGKPVTRWDGETMKVHPVTGEDVPDENARTPVYRYVNPRKAEWPEAEFIVGNPPYIGNKRMRISLGDGYVDALRAAHEGLPESADYVMYWWDHAAGLVHASSLRRFGFITTNSVTQEYNKRIVQAALDSGASIVFAIPDHPWVDSSDGAAVRIAMSVGERGFNVSGLLARLLREVADSDPENSRLDFIKSHGVITSALTVGFSNHQSRTLLANEGLSFMGVTLSGGGFILSEGEAESLKPACAVVKPYFTGRDLNQTHTNRFVIDFFGFTLDQAMKSHPAILQHVADRVKPDRYAKASRNADAAAYADSWWLFAKTRPEMRCALEGLSRFIATCRTARHRVFTFVAAPAIPESTVIAIALCDAADLAVLSSRLHTTWALASGSRLGVGNDPRYNNSSCFDPFPFPCLDEVTKQRIRNLGEQLDSHRKRQQEQHPDLTITGMYNVIEKLRSGEPLTAKEKKIHEDGLVSVLRQIHDDLDAAVFDAYGWPRDLTDEQILERLVALNAERAAEERRGVVRWLRPEFQNPAGAATQQAIASQLPSPAAEASDKTKEPPRTWPEELPQQIAAVRDFLARGAPVTTRHVVTAFKGAKRKNVESVLDSLAALGLAMPLQSGNDTKWHSVA